MKTLSILFLFCASAFGADITTTNVFGDITTKISERTDADGKPQIRFETIYRGKEKILSTLSRTNNQGTLVVVSRSYLVGGDSIMIESDEDGDGAFERILIEHPGTGNFEMFRRQSDGSVKPVSTQTVEATKKQMLVVDESMRKLIGNCDPSDQEISDLLQQTKQKVEDLQKQKKNDEK